MTTYTWPDGRAFVPSASTLRVRHNQERYSESPLSGFTQTLALPGSRWGWALDWPATMTQTEAAALEAMVVRLSGRQHRVRVWDFKRPRPQGDIALDGVTVASTAAQFETQIQLAGCRNTSNLLQGGGFELDTNADGLSDGLTTFFSGASTGRTWARTDGNGSTWAQYALASTLGTTASDAIGWFHQSAAVQAGNTYTFSADLKGSLSGLSYSILVHWLNSGLAFVSPSVLSGTLPVGVFDRKSFSAVAPVGAAYARVYFTMQANSTGAANPFMVVDNVKVESGAAATPFGPPATFRAGDWMSPGQLLMVAADAQADDLGRMTVEVRHMLRSAISAGAAVTLDKPTGLYMLADSATSFQRVPGPRQGGFSLELVEVFA